MTDDRRLDVLRAIVEDYVATHEPVGSKALLERHHLGVSPATVRNDMAVLEDEGYLSQPHTSAGRVPTEKGYRVFVDRLAEVKALSAAERRAIESFLAGAVDIDDVVNRSVKALAHLTNQIAVVQYPSLTRSTVRHIEIVGLDGPRVLLVVISSTGRVEQRIVDLPEELSDELIVALRSRVLRTVTGERLVDASVKLADMIETFDPKDRPVVSTIVTTMSSIFSNEQSDQRIVVGGTANVGFFGPDFETSIRPVLEAIEENVVLLKLLGESSSQLGPRVTIGSETGSDNLAGTSVVATSYGTNSEPLASLGTVGPTRMDYPATMAAVAAVARYVGRMLADG